MNFLTQCLYGYIITDRTFIHLYNMLNDIKKEAYFAMIISKIDLFTLCMCMCTICVQCPQVPEEGVRSPGAGVTNDCWNAQIWVLETELKHSSGFLDSFEAALCIHCQPLLEFVLPWTSFIFPYEDFIFPPAHFQNLINPFTSFWVFVCLFCFGLHLFSDCCLNLYPELFSYAQMCV